MRLRLIQNQESILVKLIKNIWYNRVLLGGIAQKVRAWDS